MKEPNKKLKFTLYLPGFSRIFHVLPSIMITRFDKTTVLISSFWLCFSFGGIRVAKM